jgi:hypothetical protein
MHTTTETPAKNLRVGRCHGYFAWPGSDPIGCPVCGDTLQTTTRLQRQEAWQILDREETRRASRLPGGLPALIAYERGEVDRTLTMAGDMLTSADGWTITVQTEGDRIARREHSTWNLDGILRGADKRLAKIARLQRKLDKLVTGMVA